MEKLELREILDSHKKWLNDDGGEKAGLRYAGLRDAGLGGANLRGADLGYANLGDAGLGGADLRGANLRGANLRGANLRGADLRGADLRDADLRRADLRYANLRYAGLGDADLRGADLRDADLRDADVYPFSFGCDFGFAHFGSQYPGGNYVKISCVNGTIQEVLDVYEAEGVKAGYTPREIAMYGGFLNWLNIEAKKLTEK